MYDPYTLATFYLLQEGIYCMYLARDNKLLTATSALVQSTKSLISSSLKDLGGKLLRLIDLRGGMGRAQVHTSGQDLVGASRILP